MRNVFIKAIGVLLFSIIVISCSNATVKRGSDKDLSTLNIYEEPEWLKLIVNEAFPSEGFNLWIPTNNFKTSSLIRVPKYPRKISDIEIKKNEALKDFEIVMLAPDKKLRLTSVKNEQVSAQIALGATTNLSNVSVVFKDFKSEDGHIFSEDNIKIRYVKYIPVQRARSEYVWSPKMESVIGEGVSGSQSPSFVGDPLIETDSISVDAYTAQPIWFTFEVPKRTMAGIYEGLMTITTEEYESVSHKVSIEVLNAEIPDSDEYKFHLDLWLNPSSIAEYYKLDHWSEQHWDMISKYLKDYASRGGKNIATTITHEPWHKVWINNTTRSQSEFGYQSMVKWLKNENGSWEFDYSIFDRYVATATRFGIDESINAFSLTPFHTKQKIYYFDKSDGLNKELELDIRENLYKEVWSTFLISFKRHLIETSLFERTYLGFDEKPEEELKILYEIISNSAPEFMDRIVIAGHPEVGEKAKNLSISYMFFPGQPLEKKAAVSVLPTIKERTKTNRTTTFYLCAEPAHPNTLTYSPAVEAQVIPWLALKYKTDGYLRWAYNNWTKDPFNKPVFIHNQGDDYYVYPGENGPISSIRWELLKEGIEDYELFWKVKENQELSKEELDTAIEFATKNQDGRYKNVIDLLEARIILTNKIKTQRATKKF